MSGSEICHYSSGEAGEWLDTDADGQGNNADPDDDNKTNVKIKTALGAKSSFWWVD